MRHLKKSITYFSRSATMGSMNSILNRRDFIRTSAVAAAAVASLPSALAQSEKPLTVALVGGGHIHTPGFVKLAKSRPSLRVKAV